MGDKENTLLCIYKEARDTVRHFDVMLSNFRKTAFLFNSTVVVGYIVGTIKINNAVYEIVRDNSLTLGMVALVFNYLIWFLEKHYHKYLMFSAQVGKEIESVLKVPCECSLAERVYYASTIKGPYQARVLYQIRRALRIKYYDTIYFFPILAVNISSLFFMQGNKNVLLIAFAVQLYFIWYLLCYDEEVKRKLGKKAKVGRFEKVFKKVIINPINKLINSTKSI